jgi:predicted oxidoreductase
MVPCGAVTALPLSDAPRRLGKSDLSVFPLAWGMWRFAGADLAAARARVEAALEAGFTLFDTADIYGRGWDGPGEGGAEALLGRVLREAPRLRGRMVLATKGGIVSGVPYDSSARHLRAACEASLTRLGVDCIDLYQIHRPDLLAHPEDVARTLLALRQEGKLRELGVSNFTPAQTEALQAFLPVPLATQQPELSAWCLAPLFDGVLDQCMARGMTPLAWSPLAGGRLALRPEDALREPGGARLEALVECLDGLAAGQGTTRDAVALAFLLAHPSGVIPILGTQRPERMRAARDAFRVELSRGDWYRIVEAARGEAMP